MAKLGKINHNDKRRRMVEQYRERRDELRALISHPDTPDDDRFEAVRKLASMPRNASRVRVRNRCRVTGRPRGYYRKFQMSRIALRDKGLAGEVAGLKKASW